MKRWFKVVLAFVLVLAAALAALPFLLNANQFRPLLESQLSAAAGREVKLGSLSLSLFAGQVSASDVSVAEDPAFGTTPFLRAKSLAASVEMKPLIFDRKLNVTSVIVDHPEVNLVLAQSGAWNISTLGAKTEPKPGSKSDPKPDSVSAVPDLAVGLVHIADGRFTLNRAGDPKPEVFDDIDVDLKNLALTAPFDFVVSAKRAEGGSIHVEGKAGPLDSKAAHPPVEATFTIPQLDVRKAGLVEASTGMSGLVSLSGSARWKDNQAELNGKLTGEQLKLAKGGSPASRPVHVDFVASHDIARRRGRLQRVDLHIGKAASRLAGTYDLSGKRPSFALKFVGDKMPLAELLAILPALDIKLPAGSSLEGGTLSADFTLAGTLERFSATGPIGLDKTRLANFDFGSKLKTLEKLAGIQASPNTDIETLRANVKHTPEATQIDAIEFNVPAIGDVTGAGAISPKDDLDFAMQAVVHTRGAMMTALGQRGDTRAPFTVTGNIANPVIKANLKAIAVDKVERLVKDPVKAVNAAQSILELFRKKPAPDQPKESQ